MASCTPGFEERCRKAKSQKCECLCGGEFHGYGGLFRIRVPQSGKVPQLQLFPLKQNKLPLFPKKVKFPKTPEDQVVCRLVVPGTALAWLVLAAEFSASGGLESFYVVVEETGEIGWLSWRDAGSG